ncbi:MAG TPA: serine--tRNA ligase [Bacillota bacterium]|nr:serine--tRNA ligase [Bacillota bacterium]
MLDPEIIRTQPEAVRDAVRKKGAALDVERLIAVDGEWRQLTFTADELRARRNKLGKAGPSSREEGARVKEELREVEERLRAAEQERAGLLLQVPAIPAPDVPVGPDASANVPVKYWGTLPTFDFRVRDHVELLLGLGALETERTAAFAGSRAYTLRNAGVLLEQAVFRMAIDLIMPKGFDLLEVPTLIGPRPFFGTGHFPDNEGQTYEVEGRFLAGTAEVPLLGLHLDQIIAEADLPVRHLGLSACYRREAGAAGRDTRGLYRVHEFRKLEQFVVCAADPELSDRIHYELLANSEALMQALELPYRVVANSTGDMGLGKVRMHDIETWMPGRGDYGETHSCSSLHDWQARRAGIRYRDGQGRVRYAFTLNNTAAASPRILIPLVETHQQPDGSVRVPAALRPYLGGTDVFHPV